MRQLHGIAAVAVGEMELADVLALVVFGDGPANDEYHALAVRRNVYVADLAHLQRQLGRPGDWRLFGLQGRRGGEQRECPKDDKREGQAGRQWLHGGSPVKRGKGGVVWKAYACVRKLRTFT